MKIFTHNESRDAWNIIRGYVYQVDLTIEQWLSLKDHQLLQLESGEDFDILPWLTASTEKEYDRLLGQVKHLDSRLTLNTDEATTAIANFLEHQKNNDSLDVIFCFITNTTVTKERKSFLSDPAIIVWEQLRNGTYINDEKEALDDILNILRARPKPRKLNDKTWETYKEFVETVTHDVLYQKLISKFQWNTGQKPAYSMRQEVQKLLVDRKYAEDEKTAELQYPRLFLHVFKLLTHSGDKRLTSDDRKQVLHLPILDDYDENLFGKVVRQLANVRTIDELFNSNPLYPYLTDLFVPPIEFDEIKNTLGERNAVFLVSEPHMGKTFTAVYLLLIYHQQGYQIEWLFRDDPRLSIHGRFQGSGHSDFEQKTLEEHVAPRTILYLEDPYGQDEGDLSYSKKLKLSSLLQRASEISETSDSSSPKIVITLRRSIWNYVVQNIDPQLKDWAIDTQKSISYDAQRCQDILEKYIGHIRPAWANQSGLRERVLKRASEHLIAPHNIYWFVERSKEQDDWISLIATIQRSAEIKTALAHEIDLLAQLEQLVFVTVYVTTFRPHVQSWKNSMVQAFFLGSLRKHLECYYAFASVLGHEADDNLESKFITVLRTWKEVFTLPRFSLDKFTSKHQRLIKVTFQHSSYAEAVSIFINKGGPKTIFAELGNQVQGLVLEFQTQEEGLALIHPLVSHKSSLRPAAVKQIRSLFTEGIEIVRTKIIEALLANYHQLPEKLDPLLTVLNPNDDKEIWYLFMRTAWPNPYIDREQRLRIWNLALGKGTIYPPIPIVPFHPLDGPFIFFNSLPDDLQQVFWQHLESRKQWSWYCLAHPLTEHFSRIPTRYQKWIFTLADEGNEYVVFQIMIALAHNYLELPPAVTSLIERFAAAPNWKFRAYLVTWFRNRLESLSTKHRQVIEQLILYDSDVRVRTLPVYTELQLVGAGSDTGEQESIPHIYMSLIFSDRPEDQTGALFALFHGSERFHLAIQAKELRMRLNELLKSQEPVVVALIKYVLSNEQPELLATQLDESSILPYKSFVEDFARDVVSVYLGPGN